jgi:hypothetical protein
MGFVGGEKGIEAELRLVHALRSELPEIRDGAVDYDVVSVTDDSVYAVLRHSADRATLIAVNVSDAALTTDCKVKPRDALTLEDRTFDAWASEWLPCRVAADGWLRLELELSPYQARVLILGDPSAAPTAARLAPE